MFHDFRARNVGDVLTVFIEESTGFDAQEKREMEKKTNAGINHNGTGSTSGLAGVLRSFGYALDLNTGSNRKFEGNNNSSIDRKFTDRMSFIVVNVMPNGNLIVEGYRQRLITREMRVLRVCKGLSGPRISVLTTLCNRSSWRTCASPMRGKVPNPATPITAGAASYSTNCGRIERLDHDTPSPPAWFRCTPAGRPGGRAGPARSPACE